MRILSVIVFLCLLFPPSRDRTAAADAVSSCGSDGKTRILCTTFPIYQITRNVTAGRDAVRVSLLLPAAAGCPHDYALIPRDMALLAAADILVINGLGMEDFLGAPLERVNPGARIIDSSAGTGELPAPPDDGGEGGNGHGHDADHGGEGPNPHLFASPAMSARLAWNIADGLSRLEPDGAGTYAANAARYSGAMRRLCGDMRRAAGRWPNRRVVEPHGAFDHLARDIGLEIVGVLQPHGEELSAAGMLELVRNIEAGRPAAILLEPHASPKAGETLSRETGVPALLLDPVSSGPDDAPLDYFETVMRRNLELLEQTLGGEPATRRPAGRAIRNGGEGAETDDAEASGARRGVTP